MNIYGCGGTDQGYTNPNCDQDFSEGARVRSTAYVDDDADIDESTPTLFAQSLLAAEKACKATIVRAISGQLNDPSPITGPGYGDQLETELGQEHSFEYTDRDYIKHNIGYYDNLKRQIEYKKVYYMTETLAWPIERGKASLSHRKSISNSTTEKAVGIITVKWQEDEASLPIPIDRELLKEPQDLFDPTAMVFINVGASDAVISTDGGTISQTVSVPFEVELDTNIALSTIEVTKGTLPTGVVAVVSPTDNTKLVISGSSATPGTKKVSLKVMNACKIFTTVEVIINIEAA